jgi:sugar O-acyltransferase (sialic acid O-acetyltransferase NeuD family)
MKHKILLIGAGGHCKVVLDLLLQIKEYEIAGILDLKENLGAGVFGVPVIGTDADLPRFFKSGIRHCFISVGSVGNPHLRIKLYNLAKKSGFVFPNLISLNAKVSSHVILGKGNYIAPGVVINAGTQIGNNCILNTGAIIEHDCKIGNFVHLSPGSVLSGGVNIGDNCHIGTGSVIIQNVQIAEETIIGAGSVVMKNIRKGMVAYGNPCKERKANA